MFRAQSVSHSPKYVKRPKKDSLIKVSLESDLLFSVEIWLKLIFQNERILENTVICLIQS